MQEPDYAHLGFASKGILGNFKNSIVGPIRVGIYRKGFQIHNKKSRLVRNAVLI